VSPVRPCGRRFRSIAHATPSNVTHQPDIRDSSIGPQASLHSSWSETLDADIPHAVLLFAQASALPWSASLRQVWAHVNRQAAMAERLDVLSNWFWGDIMVAVSFQRLRCQRPVSGCSCTSHVAEINQAVEPM